MILAAINLIDALRFMVRCDAKTFYYVVASWIALGLLAIMCIIIPEAINDWKNSRSVFPDKG